VLPPPEAFVAPPLVSLDEVELTLVEAVSEVDVSPFLLPHANRNPASASTARIETAFFIALSFLQIKSVRYEIADFHQSACLTS
jgi:hypothetical protein